MKPKYVAGQMVIHKLDRRRMIVIAVFDSANADDFTYACRYTTNDGIYINAEFTECELIENEDII